MQSALLIKTSAFGVGKLILNIVKTMHDVEFLLWQALLLTDINLRKDFWYLILSWETAIVTQVLEQIWTLIYQDQIFNICHASYISMVTFYYNF